MKTAPDIFMKAIYSQSISEGGLYIHLFPSFMDTGKLWSIA